VLKKLESEHRAHAAFYSPVTLFDNVVQIETVSNLDGTVPTITEFVIHSHAAQSGMGGLKAIQGNYPRLAVALESFTEEGLGGGDVVFPRQTLHSGLTSMSNNSWALILMLRLPQLKFGWIFRLLDKEYCQTQAGDQKADLGFYDGYHG
jgi:hypothetical protein